MSAAPEPVRTDGVGGERRIGVPADLDPDELEKNPLGTRTLGRAFQVWRETASTNDIALRAAAVRSNEGLVVVADSQSAGRGQRGRRWLAPPGGAVLMSVVLFPEPPLDRPEALVMLTAVAVARALAPWVTSPPQIKWPNDLYLAERKLGGILVERNVGTVVGIGLNVHAAPPDDGELRATRLADHTREPPHRGRLIREILRSLDALCTEAHAGDPRDGLAPLIAEWKRAVLWLGEPVEVETAEGREVGTLVDLDPTSGLTLRPGVSGVRFVPAANVVRMRRVGNEGTR